MAVNKFCPACGAVLITDALFCDRCGLSVSASPPPILPSVALPLQTQGQYSNDGQWWWNGRQWLAVAPPTSSSTPSSRVKAKKGWGLIRILLVVFVIVPLLLIAAITVALFVYSSQNPPPCGCGLPPPNSTSELNNDYTTLVAIDNTSIAQQNSQDAPTSIRA